jgi:hypothetical protein
MSDKNSSFASAFRRGFGWTLGALAALLVGAVASGAWIEYEGARVSRDFERISAAL